MKKVKLSPSVVMIGILCFLGLCVLSLPGYRFTGFLLLMGAALVGIYALLRLLAHKHPKAAKGLHRLLTVGLCCLLALAMVTGIIIVRGSLGDPDASCRYIIVLGAGVNGTVPSLTLRERLDAALAYLQTHPNTLCVVTGGQGPGEDITEAACMADWLTSRGIDPERILLEDKSTSTRENLTFALDILEAHTGTRPTTAGIISSEYHMFRAGQLAEDLGLHGIGIPARTTWFPLRMNYYLREIAATWKYIVFGG